MNIDSFYRQTRPGWRMPTSHCFAWRVNIDAFASAHDACIGPNDFGIDGLNKILRLLINRIDQAGRKTTHQIPIACTLI